MSWIMCVFFCHTEILLIVVDRVKSQQPLIATASLLPLIFISHKIRELTTIAMWAVQSDIVCGICCWDRRENDRTGHFSLNCNRNALTPKPRWCSRRAIANPSPPLLPVPHNITNNVSFGRFSLIKKAHLVAARSINSVERMLAALIVYSSHARTWAAVNIFIMPK